MKDDPLPEFLRPIFWDTDFDRLCVAGHERYIIERVLEYGDVPQVRWMMSRFPREQLAQVLRRSRRLGHKSARFWASILDVPSEEVRCLTAPSRQPYDRIWRS